MCSQGKPGPAETGLIQPQRPSQDQGPLVLCPIIHKCKEPPPPTNLPVTVSVVDGYALWDCQSVDRTATWLQTQKNPEPNQANLFGFLLGKETTSTKS